MKAVPKAKPKTSRRTLLFLDLDTLQGVIIKSIAADSSCHADLPPYIKYHP